MELLTKQICSGNLRSTLFFKQGKQKAHPTIVVTTLPPLFLPLCLGMLVLALLPYTKTIYIMFVTLFFS